MAWVQGFLSQGDPQQNFHPQSLQIRTCPQENPVPAKVVQLLSRGVRPEQGKWVPALPHGQTPLAFPLLKWEERNRVDQPPLIFFACKTGFLDVGNIGQGFQGCLDFRSPDGPGRMWLSLGEIISALPCPAPPQPQAAHLMTSLGKVLSLQHLSAAVQRRWWPGGRLS